MKVEHHNLISRVGDKVRGREWLRKDCTVSLPGAGSALWQTATDLGHLPAIVRAVLSEGFVLHIP